MDQKTNQNIVSNKIHLYKVLHDVLEKTFNQNNRFQYKYDQNRLIAEIIISDEKMTPLLSSEIIAEIARKLMLGPIKIKSNDIVKYLKYWDFLGFEVGPNLDNQSSEFILQESGKIIAYYIQNRLVFCIGELLSSMILPGVDDKNIKYYVVSNDSEEDMTYEKFVVANTVRKNGVTVFYDSEDKPLTDLDLDKQWIVLIINRKLYNQGRCKVYRPILGSDQIQGEMYYKNIGRLCYT